MSESDVTGWRPTETALPPDPEHVGELARIYAAARERGMLDREMLAAIERIARVVRVSMREIEDRAGAV